MSSFSFHAIARLTGLLAAICAFSILASCKKPEKKPPPPQKKIKAIKPALRTPVAFSDIPGWESDNFSAAWPAFLASCSVLAEIPKWQPSCSVANLINPNSEKDIRHFFESQFTPYQLRNTDRSDTGLATGYYEPLLTGARTRSEHFDVPLHAVPDDLLSLDLASVYPDLKGMRLRGRLEGNKVVPYFPRADITQSQKMADKVLLWVDDPIDAFFLQVQGSGRVQLSDTGETVRVAFADVNGHPYKSIGRHLVKTGELKRSQASAQGIKNWLKKNPSQRQALLNVNPRYVFFREEKLLDPQKGPKGALAVALTPQRSIAVDPQFIPLGAPVFISTSHPNSKQPLQQLVMAQDTGAAIKGGVRADFFWGFGKNAGLKAGKMMQQAKMWLLLPNHLSNKDGLESN